MIENSLVYLRILEIDFCKDQSHRASTLRAWQEALRAQVALNTGFIKIPQNRVDVADDRVASKYN